MCQVAHRLSTIGRHDCTLANPCVQNGQESSPENEPSLSDGTPSVSKLRGIDCVPAGTQCGPLVVKGRSGPVIPIVAGRRCLVRADQVPR